MLKKHQILIVVLALLAAACAGSTTGKNVWKLPTPAASSAVTATHDVAVSIATLASGTGAVFAGRLAAGSVRGRPTTASGTVRNVVRDKDHSVRLLRPTAAERGRHPVRISARGAA